MPDQVLVYASEDDLRSGASPLLVKGFDPDLKGSRVATVELSGDRNVCTIKGVVKDFDYTIIIEGGVVYELSEGHICGQVKPGETITISVTAPGGHTYWIIDEYGGDGFNYLDYPGKREFYISGNKTRLLYTVNRQLGESQLGALCGMISFTVVENYTETPVSSLEY